MLKINVLVSGRNLVQIVAGLRRIAAIIESGQARGSDNVDGDSVQASYQFSKGDEEAEKKVPDPYDHLSLHR